MLTYSLCQSLKFNFFFEEAVLLNNIFYPVTQFTKLSKKNCNLNSVTSQQLRFQIDPSISKSCQTRAIIKSDSPNQSKFNCTRFQIHLARAFRVASSRFMSELAKCVPSIRSSRPLDTIYSSHSDDELNYHVSVALLDSRIYGDLSSSTRNQIAFNVK